jgi:phage shock protein A
MSTTTLKQQVERFCKDTTNLHSQVGKLKDQVDALKSKLKTKSTQKTAKAPKPPKEPKVLKSVHDTKIRELKLKIEELKSAHKTVKAPRAPRAPKAPKTPALAEPMLPAPVKTIQSPVAAPSFSPSGPVGGKTRRRV